MNSELRRACIEGKTASEGGMNLPELRKYAIGKGLVSRKDAMTYSRREIEEMILNSVEQSGGGKKTIVRRDVDENYKHTFLSEVYVIERKDKDGKLHSTLGKPARIWRNDGVNYLREWYKHGKLHRKGGKPAHILKYFRRHSKALNPSSYFIEKVWYNDGNIIKIELVETDLGKEEWQEITNMNSNHNLHSFEDRPGFIKLEKIGLKITHEAPGENTEWGPIRRISEKMWFKNGQKHRSGNKPATITYNPKTGKVIHEEYWVNGKFIKALKK